MTESTYKIMQEELDSLGFEKTKVLDVGSLDVNGTYKPLVTNKGWEYIGLDLIPGKNVDVVADDPFHYPFYDNKFDIVLSGSTMEHVTRIWEWVPELVRILKPEGRLVIVTHWAFPEHKYPIDCWRIMPDGMQYLFDMTSELENYGIRIENQTDIIGAATKKEKEK